MKRRDFLKSSVSLFALGAIAPLVPQERFLGFKDSPLFIGIDPAGGPDMSVASVLVPRRGYREITEYEWKQFAATFEIDKRYPWQQKVMETMASKYEARLRADMSARVFDT